MLRIGPSFPGETGSFMKVDQKRRQVTLYDPSTVGHVSQTHRKMGVAAPKMFAFDSIFESDSTQVSEKKLHGVVYGVPLCPNFSPVHSYRELIALEFLIRFKEALLRLLLSQRHFVWHTKQYLCRQ